MNKTVAKIKRVNASPAFLISALAFTLATIVSAVGATTLPAALSATLTQILASQPALEAAKNNLLPVFQALPIYFYVSLGASLIVSTGMWLHYFANKSASESVTTTGLTIIKIVKAVEAALTVLGFLAVGFMGITTGLVLVEAFNQLSPDSVSVWAYTVFGVCCGIFLLIFIFTILYYRGIFRTIKSVKMTLSTGVIMGKVSTYVVIANYCIALVTLVNAIVSPEILVLLSGVLKTVGLVFCSIAMTKLHSEMRYIARRGGDSPE